MAERVIEAPAKRRATSPAFQTAAWPPAPAFRGMGISSNRSVLHRVYWKRSGGVDYSPQQS
jgi:hypothetical protein